MRDTNPSDSSGTWSSLVNRHFKKAHHHRSLLQLQRGWATSRAAVSALGLRGTRKVAARPPTLRPMAQPGVSLHLLEEGLLVETLDKPEELVYPASVNQGGRLQRFEVFRAFQERSRNASNTSRFADAVPLLDVQSPTVAVVPSTATSDASGRRWKKSNQMTEHWAKTNAHG